MQVLYSVWGKIIIIVFVVSPMEPRELKRMTIWLSKNWHGRHASNDGGGAEMPRKKRKYKLLMEHGRGLWIIKCIIHGSMKIKYTWGGGHDWRETYTCGVTVILACPHASVRTSCAGGGALYSVVNKKKKSSRYHGSLQVWLAVKVFLGRKK